MNQSYDSDSSLSPSQILERLQMLRQLQLMQRGKLQKQRLQYQENSDTSSCITELINHFTNSVNTTSYNTFQSLLKSSPSITEDGSPRFSAGDSCRKVQDKDLIDGVSVLNLSQESEFIENTPTSARSRASAHSNSHVKDIPQNDVNKSLNNDNNLSKRNVISLDEMPVLSPGKDFESLVIEKLQNEKSAENTNSSNEKNAPTKKRPFLKRGEGMTRFGLKKNDLVIQSITSLPWKKKKCMSTKSVKESLNLEESKDNNGKSNEDIVVPPLKLNVKRKCDKKMIAEKCKSTNTSNSNISSAVTTSSQALSDNSSLSTQPEFKVPDKIINLPKGKHPILASKGKTWASILTKEQNDFLSQLKQSDYYKSFASPAKSTTSNLSCDEHTSNLRQEKESAEQNLFELLESKVSHESFHLENSFFNRFFKRSTLECSGESTPIVMQRCLANNPKLMHILPDTDRQRNVLYNDVTCQSDYTECCSDACSSVSSCCSCKTATEPPTPQIHTKEHCKEVPQNKKEVRIKVNDKCQNEVDKENDTMKANMVEMNEKLISTSEILKQRLQELEDEIETFRKENMNLNKMKEDVESERQKFYEEKKNFEQKFNEEKILSEYYLAEEKEKLNKQKQMYERYVREMRGRLNKKEKDEVVNLKQEISTLNNEIRIKDAKSTSTIARLRNQMKIIEKEKSELQNEVEKLKKENRRIQHSNEITRRMTNMKYLEQINKKLSNMNKEPQVEVQHQNDIKYKAFEIERQSRSRKAQLAEKVTIRPRAKSVPNLKVTSRYAKYFSQRDAISQRDQNNTDVKLGIPLDDSDDEILRLDNANENSDNSTSSTYNNDNNLEDIYINTFKSNSPKSNRSSMSNPMQEINHASTNNDFFLQRSNSSSSTRDSKSPINLLPLDRSLFRSKSPISILSHRSAQRSNTHISSNISGASNSSRSSKSPATSNHWSQRLPTVIHKDICQDKLSVTPEPNTSKSTLSKSNLNPTEYRKPDGSSELRFPNGNVKHISADGKYTKFVYYNGDVKENFYCEGRIKYFYSESKTYHTTHADGLEILEFPDGQVEKRYKDGSSEVRLPNGSVRYHDPKNTHVREEWRFPDGSALTVAANGERRVVFSNGQIEVHAQDHKRREFPDGTVKLVYNDGTSETRYASGRVRIKDKHGNLIMDSAATFG